MTITHNASVHEIQLHEETARNSFISILLITSCYIVTIYIIILFTVTRARTNTHTRMHARMHAHYAIACEAIGLSMVYNTVSCIIYLSDICQLVLIYLPIVNGEAEHEYLQWASHSKIVSTILVLMHTMLCGARTHARTHTSKQAPKHVSTNARTHVCKHARCVQLRH